MCVLSLLRVRMSVCLCVCCVSVTTYILCVHVLSICEYIH